MVVRSAEAEPGPWTVAALGSKGRIVIIGCRKKGLQSGPGLGDGTREKQREMTGLGWHGT